MINNKQGSELYYTEGVAYLRAESEPLILNVDNAMYLSGGVADDATVSFAQSASTDGSGNQYIKITIGASTSTATTSMNAQIIYFGIQDLKAITRQALP